MRKAILLILIGSLLVAAPATVEAGLVRLAAKAGKRVAAPAAKAVKAVAKGAKKIVY